MFGVTNMLIIEYMQKSNELLRKQQRPTQRQDGMLEAFKINFILMIFCWLEAMLTDRLCRKTTRKKKIKYKLGTGY